MSSQICEGAPLGLQFKQGHMRPPAGNSLYSLLMLHLDVTPVINYPLVKLCYKVFTQSEFCLTSLSFIRDFESLNEDISKDNCVSLF